MNCPECGALKRDATDLYMHVWSEHRDKEFAPALYPCPWCGQLERGLIKNDRAKLRERHLKGCMPYAASRLSGVAVVDDLVNIQIQRYRTMPPMPPKPHHLADYESMFLEEAPCDVPAVTPTTVM